MEGDGGKVSWLSVEGTDFRVPVRGSAACKKNISVYFKPIPRFFINISKRAGASGKVLQIQTNITQNSDRKMSKKEKKRKRRNLMWKEISRRRSCFLFDDVSIFTFFFLTLFCL